MNRKIGLFLVVVIIIVGIGVIWYRSSDNVNSSESVDNTLNDNTQKKNYDFYGKNIVCDDLVQDEDEAMYIVDGDIYYIEFEDEMFHQYKIVSKGIKVGKVGDKLVGYVDANSVIDENYASLVEGGDYVIYIGDLKSDSEQNSSTLDEDIFQLNDVDDEHFLRGKGYAGASNKAVYLKNGIAYYLQFNGDNLVSSEVIATGVKKIGNIGDDLSRIIVVYIDKDTVIHDKYLDYDIMLDDDGSKCIKIC